MLLVSFKVVSVENEAVLLYVNYAGTCKSICSNNLMFNIWYSFCHCKVQFLWCTFQMHFCMGTRHFQKVILRMKLFLSLYYFTCHIANIRVWKYVFTHASKSKFLTLAALVSFVWRSCSTHVALVSLVSHSCCTRVALVGVALVVLVSRTRMVK